MLDDESKLVWDDTLFVRKETTQPVPFGRAEDKNTSCLQPGGASEAGERSRAGEFFGEEARPPAAYRCCPARSSACPLLLTITRAMASRHLPSHGDILNIPLGLISAQGRLWEFISLRKAVWT